VISSTLKSYFQFC